MSSLPKNRQGLAPGGMETEHASCAEERRLLIEDLAFLVVRQHHRLQHAMWEEKQHKKSQRTGHP